MDSTAKEDTPEVVEKPEFDIDMSKPVSDRPMCGFDIEEWRAGLGLNKYDAQTALGFRNSNHYNKMCDEPNLPFVIELLIRLYAESPCPPGWERYTLRELFDIMYGDALEVFADTKHQVYAKVDLGGRFTRLFGRSSARHYQWLEMAPKKTESELNAYAGIDRVLAKLKQVNDPKEVLERVSRKVWSLRGVNLDAENPVPSLANPPTREKTGRKSSPKTKLALKKAAKAAKPAAAKKAPKKVAKKVPLRKLRKNTPVKVASSKKQGVVARAKVKKPSARKAIKK